MTTLNDFGWTDFHTQFLQGNTNEGLLAGRVIAIKGIKYTLITDAGPLEAELSGKLLFGSGPEDLPVVGDWVLFMDYGTMGYVISVFPRQNVIARKNPGTKTERQILAANVDVAFIVQGLDDNFNIRRLERYLVQLISCNIIPAVILNKVDLVVNPDAYREEVLNLHRECPVYLCSTHTGEGVGELALSLQKSKTYVFIGSSGVGKSSLLNYLMNDEVQKISATSESNRKGKHTTTSRDLFLLPNGSLLIDTPGMREFGVTLEEGQSTEGLFPLIDEFSSRCKFADCQHINEMGCAVIEAAGNGTLDSAAYESYLKLMREQKRFGIRLEDKKRLGKQFGKMAREAIKHRRKNKY